MSNTQTAKAGARTHKFAVGDKVTLTNDAGIKFPGKIITELVWNEVRGATYHITPTDTPWFDFNESELTKEGNRYRNPWFKSCNTPRPEFYENDAPKVFSYRGVDVYKLRNNSFDYVFSGCCITQRAGFKKESAPAIIDEILDGNQPVDNEVAHHLITHGHKALTYEQYTADWQAGLRK